jgi:hypothetical protein
VIGGKVIRIVNFADDVVLMTKEDTVAQGMLKTFMFVIPDVCIYNYLGGSNVNQHINSPSIVKILIVGAVGFRFMY